MLDEAQNATLLGLVNLREEAVVLRLLVVVALSREAFGTPVTAL